MRAPRFKLWDVHLIEELRGVVGLLRDPHDIQNIYKIEDGLMDTLATRYAADHAAAHPRVDAMIRRRYLRDAPYDLDALRRMIAA